MRKMLKGLNKLIVLLVLVSLFSMGITESIVASNSVAEVTMLGNNSSSHVTTTMNVTKSDGITTERVILGNITAFNGTATTNITKRNVTTGTTGLGNVNASNITQEQTSKVKKEGFKVEVIYPQEPKPIVKSSGVSDIVPLGSLTPVFSENFEGSFPGDKWYVGDWTSDNGDDYWDDTSYRHYGGSWSGWCADIGDNSVYGGTNAEHHKYDNNMDAYLLKKYIVDMSSWDIGYVDFWVWYNTESGYDYLIAEWYDDGWYYDSDFKLTGSGTSWTHKYWRIPDDYLISRGAFGFKFHSDGSAVKEGSYVDDIHLYSADVTLDNYYLDPTSVNPGDTFTMYYYIHNPCPFTIDVGLGASIKDSSGNVINDEDNDITVSASSGYSWKSRSFHVPSDATPGSYDVAWGIWSGIPGADSRSWGFSGWQDDELEVNPLEEEKYYLKLTNNDPDSYPCPYYIYFDIDNNHGWDSSSYPYHISADGYSTAYSGEKDISTGYHTVYMMWFDPDYCEWQHQEREEYISSGETQEYAFTLSWCENSIESVSFDPSCPLTVTMGEEINIDATVGLTAARDGVLQVWIYDSGLNINEKDWVYIPYSQSTVRTLDLDFNAPTTHGIYECEVYTQFVPGETSGPIDYCSICEVSQTDSCTINVEGKPDLIVEDIWTVPSSPKGDEPCDVYFRVKNQGNRDIDDSFRDCIDIDDISYGCCVVGGLDAGSTYNCRAEDVELCRGDHVIRTEADAYGDVDESIEGNNELPKTILWAGVNTKLTCYDKEGGQGDTLQLSAKLEEDDWPWDNDIEGRTVDFYVEGAYVGGDITDSNGMAYVNYDVSLDPGSYTIEAEFDGDCKYNPCSDTATLTVTAPPKWTFMVFLNGDNDLERCAIVDFNRMEQATNNPNVNIIVQLDRIQGYDNSNGDWTDTRRYKVKYDTDSSNFASYTENVDYWDLGELNMGESQTLIDFVNWAKPKYPADHYCLIIFNHGSGWEPTIALQPNTSVHPLGIGWDYTDGHDYLSTAELGNALDSVTSHGANKLDVVFLDACLMQMTEVEYQIKDYANYLVASENLGWAPGPYTDYLSSSSITSTTTPEQVASIIVDEYHNAISNPHTISAVNLNKLNNLASAVDNLAQKLISGLPSYKIQIENSWSACQKFDSNGDLVIDNDDAYIDLYNFSYLIKQNIADSTIQNAAQNVLTCVDSAVVAEEHRSGWFSYEGGTYFYGLDNAHGISIYFPPSEGDSYYSNYNDINLAFVADKQWDEFLNLYLDDEPPTEVTNLHSTSHSTSTWYKDNTIDVSWTAATDDSSGLDGYSIEWSHSSDTLPDESKDIEETVTSRTSPALSTANDWYFHIRSVDNADNWDDTAAHLGPFYIDIDTPSVGLDSPLDGAIIGGVIEERIPEPGILIAEAGEPLPVTLDWHGSDDGGSGLADYEYQCSENPDFGSPACGHVTPPISQKERHFSTGEHYWRVTATDNVDYEETSEIWSFITDGEAPGCSYTDPEAGDHLSDSTPTFTWKFGDTSSGNPGSGLDKYVFKVGTTVDSRGEISDPIISETFEDPEEDEEYEYTPSSPLSDGSYYWSVTAYDNIGNWRRRWTASPFVIDTNHLPTAIIDSITPDPAEQGTDTVSFSGHGTDSDGFVVAYNWRSSIDGQLSTSASFTKPASDLSVGTHTIYFKVQDDDGAWSTEDTEDLTINPAPELPTVIIGSAECGVGDTVDVPINITGASNIGFMDINVTYDASVLTATGVANGTMMVGLPNLTVAHHISAGRVNISFATYPETLTGDGELFVVTFAAGAAGNSTLDITVEGAWTGDVPPQPVAIATEDGNVTSTTSPHDPADTNHDCVVDMMELMAHISKWKSGEVGMMELMTSIGRWKLGTGGYC